MYFQELSQILTVYFNILAYWTSVYLKSHSLWEGGSFHIHSLFINSFPEAHRYVLGYRYSGEKGRNQPPWI